MAFEITTTQSYEPPQLRVSAACRSSRSSSRTRRSVPRTASFMGIAIANASP